MTPELIEMFNSQLALPNITDVISALTFNVRAGLMTRATSLSEWSDIQDERIEKAQAVLNNYTTTFDVMFTHSDVAKFLKEVSGGSEAKDTLSIALADDYFKTILKPDVIEGEINVQTNKTFWNNFFCVGFLVSLCFNLLQLIYSCRNARETQGRKYDI